MGFLSKFEGKMEDTFEGTADKMFDAPISPVQIAKKSEKQMRREKMVGAGKQYAPTLYTVLVNPDDDRRLFGYYPTLAGETETYLAAKANEQGLVMDGQPLVRFIVDEGLKHGKFDVIAEAVAAPIIAQLRNEEMQRYGLAPEGSGYGAAATYPAQQYGRAAAAAPAPAYGEEFDNYRAPNAPGARDAANRQAANQYGQEYEQPAQSYGYDEQPYEDYGQQGYEQPYGEQPYENQGYEQPYEDQAYANQAAQAAAQAPRTRNAQAGAVDPFAIADAHMGAAGAAGAGAAGVAAAAAAQRPAAAGRSVPAVPQSARAARPRPNVPPAPQVAAPTAVFASAQPAGTGAAQAPQLTRARLVDEATRRPYDLVSPTITVGRESKNSIAIPDINISRSHAELQCNPQGVWVITDLHSTNGTYVNGRKVASQPLSNGDRITLGTTNLVFTVA